jgi:preprotein translocase subunit SecE
VNQLFVYLRQSRNELSKVVWPTRPQAIRLTIAVVIFSLSLAAFIGIMDLIYTKALQTLILKG